MSRHFDDEQRDALAALFRHALMVTEGGAPGASTRAAEGALADLDDAVADAIGRGADAHDVAVSFGLILGLAEEVVAGDVRASQIVRRRAQPDPRHQFRDRQAAREAADPELMGTPARTSPYRCPTCGDPLRFEILDDERFVVAWSCLSCGAVRTTEPG
ncbi:hypothetical protein KZX37_03280 [Microbacterium sp. EYE_5]|uniref:hypothetical protein n=1 Tax=unclassified Microbacterium TaxID=2609290 RepID=UPI0020043F81|nr:MULTISPECIES: hypothetical protein [unclassified Microbacterium]MCK6079641.1 hypothetical protein [Microbacterium sp. EYE_382]MCK6084912.1 hypothetical protein [Microbacterium sp. EYE_384]MCK6122862.1 hypothetical protein [Microbacterium sp. EYE_80]MCK6125675.1 hypothetical protein [Microbacterium sp. EYE_79]MCK6140596.1 hypothetical protein [Microbacterium sp. EYE_39]